VRRERQAGVVVLALHVAGAEAELEPAAGERVEGRDLAREQRRVPEVGVEHVGPQAQPGADGRRGGEQRERRRGAEVVRHAQDVHAAALGGEDLVPERRRLAGAADVDAEGQGRAGRWALRRRFGWLGHADDPPAIAGRR
jgi:hypothetical protein